MTNPATAALPRCAALLLLLLSLATAHRAPAQAGPADDYAARSVARIAHLDLRARPMPEPDDYLIAERILAVATRFAPDDEELLRARVRAAWAAGDNQAVAALTRELIRLDPRDTVAQLRLISSRLRSMQIAEERLAAYDRLLGSAGASLDPAVRSRLALDAALLARERQDEAGFGSRLTLAMQLDPSHKEAASLAWSYFSPYIENPVDRVELLLNLLYADPIDPNVHQMLALELARAGAFTQARRFQTIARNLIQLSKANIDEQTAMAGVVIGWQVEGPEVAISSLNGTLAMLRQTAAQNIAYYESQKLPTEALPKPDTIMLDPVSNQIRLVAAIMAEDQSTIDAALYDMTRALTATVEAAREADRLSGEQERFARALQVWAEISQHLVAIGWAGVESATLADWTGRSREAFDPESAIPQMLGAWNELRNGDPAVAVTRFENLQAPSPLNDVGRAIALEESGRQDEALALLKVIARSRPLSLSGVWARGRHTKLTGVDPTAGPEQGQVARIAAAIPSWVDDMTTDPTRFMTVSVRAEKNTVEATEGVDLRLRIRNLAPVPLALGGDRALNSRFLLAPRVEAGIHPIFARAAPEVVELDRRLRLMPTEAVEASVSPDRGMSGWLSESASLRTITTRWRALQGYSISADGMPAPGQLCLDVDTDAVIRKPLANAPATPLELASSLETAPASEFPDLLATCRARILIPRSSATVLTPDEIARLASVAAQRYPHLPPAIRAAMLSVLPTPRVAPQMAEFETAAREETDPGLVPLMLVTTVVSADDELLDTFIDGDDPDLRTFALALRNRLRSTDPTYSRYTRSVLGVGN